MQTNEVSVDGLKIGYRRAGMGPPLVLLHGYVGDGLATWGPQLDALSDEFDVIAWDAPGSGPSSDPAETFTLADFADCLAGFIRALDIERPHVAGLSWGGALALELYRRYPKVPRSLVLASAYAGWAGSLPAKEVDRRLRQALELSELTPDRLVEELMPTMFSTSVPPDIEDRFADSLRSFHPVGLRAMSRAVAAADLRNVCAQVGLPTLLIYGGADVRAPIEIAEAMEQAIPDSTLVLVPGAGHVVNLEAPDIFDAQVRTFLQERG